jgi:hypothetical protein
LQSPSQTNGNNLKNIIYEASRHFRNTKREYLREKINEHETNRKNKNIGDLNKGKNEFGKGYQPRTNIVKGENSVLLQIPTLY